MKIQPRKTAAVPKYAALMAAAVMLTGCGYSGEIALDGDTQVIDSQVQIDGDMQVCPDDTEEILNAAAAETEPEPESDLLQFEGDVALSAVVGYSSEKMIKNVFARFGFILENAEEDACFDGAAQTAWFIDPEKKIMVSFFDTGIGLEKRYAQNGAEAFDWGFIAKTKYPGSAEETEEYLTALIAVSPEHRAAVTEDETVEIVADLIRTESAGTEVQSNEN